MKTINKWFVSALISAVVYFGINYLIKEKIIFWEILKEWLVFLVTIFLTCFVMNRLFGKKKD